MDAFDADAPELDTPRKVTRADAFPAPRSLAPDEPPASLSPETVASLEAIRAADASRSAVKSFVCSLLVGSISVVLLFPALVPCHRHGASHASAERQAEIRAEREAELARARLEQDG